MSLSYSGGSHRLRHVPADLGSANDVQHPAALQVDEQKPGARVHFQIAESVEEQISANNPKAKFVLLNSPARNRGVRDAGDIETLRGVVLVELRRPGRNKERVCFGNKADLVIA